MSGNYLPPRLLQAVGLLLLLAFAVFWGLTGRESVLLVSSAISLILLGAYGSLGQTLKQITPPPTPPPITEQDDDQAPPP